MKNGGLGFRKVVQMAPSCERQESLDGHYVVVSLSPNIDPDM